MRRAIAAAVVGGLALGGVAATPAFAAVHGGTKARLMARADAATTSTTALKTVVYEGYEFQVPASWPVYQLDQNPTTCVRFDVQAVYLGIPGADMQCPAGLAGRTQTVSFIPSTVVAAGSGSEITDQSEQPDGAGGVEVQHLGAVDGNVMQDAADHELRVVLGTASQGATVVATYGTSPTVVEQVLASLRTAPASAAAGPQTGPSQAYSRPAAGQPGTAAQAVANGSAPAQKSQPVSTAWKGVPANWPVQIVLPPIAPPAPKSAATVQRGFDTCTAPSLQTMRAWRADYSAVGVYIGGVNSACAYGNLSASWIASAAAMGYGMLPTYVGPQAPCWGYQGDLIDPSKAAAEGQAAAANAVSDARVFGLGPGTPIYYDMEAYAGDQACTTAVLTFLSAWDRTLDQAGYVSGAYSSQDSGIADMNSAARARTSGFTPPDAIWFALWDGVASLNDGGLYWPVTDRSKQYEGNVNVTVGGITLDIDADEVGGPLAR